MVDNKGSEFFVGYLPMPERLGRFYKALVVFLLAIGAGLAYWVAASQQSVGQGQWLVAETRTVSGFLSNDPYPILHATGDKPRSVMLVIQGKQAAHAIVNPLAGSHVSITGVPIQRGGWELLELRGADAIIASQAPPGTISPKTLPLQNVELSGEIVDSKCFMGVMKPGAGKVHRACAALCIAGGIPPMLVVAQKDGARYGYLLVDSNGETAASMVIDDVAVPVRVAGQLERRGDLTYLKINPDGIERI
ncbi:MAG: hypothetical protein ACR2P1_02350 [Pseudomonadales bacterium]